MLQREHSAILSTFIKLPFVIKIYVLSIFEWPFYTCFTVFVENPCLWYILVASEVRIRKIFFIHFLNLFVDIRSVFVFADFGGLPVLFCRNSSGLAIRY